MKQVIALFIFTLFISKAAKTEDTIQYETNHLWLIISNDSSKPITGQNFTLNECVNTLLENFELQSFERVFPKSNNELLSKLFMISFSNGDIDSLIHQLTFECPDTYDEILKIPVFEEVQTAYNPNDWLWQQNDLWHLENINASDAWDITKGSSDIKVAILDSWFDPNHPDLEHKFITDYDPFNPNIQFSSDCFKNHHGTGVASVIAAHTDGGGQLASIGFNTMMIPYMAHGLSSPSYVEYLQKVYHASFEMNANIVTSSAGGWRCSNWGIQPTLYELEKQLVKDILDNGTTIIVPAGNGYGSGGKCTTGSSFSAFYPLHPNHDDRIIIVSSIGQDNKHYQYYNGSEKTHSHFSQVDLCAPGFNLMIAEPTETPNGSFCDPVIWPYSGFGSGTSYATPLVAGTAALLLAVNPCLSPTSVKDILKSTTAPIADANDYIGLIGTGRLDAHAAVLAAQQYGQHPAVVSTTTFSNDYFVKDELVIENGGHLTVTGTIRFAKDAKLIVKQGGKLTVDGGTLTNSIGCQNEFWAGIEVWGYNYSNQTAIQGQVELIAGAVIENAKDGIRAWEPGNYNSGGGIVNVNNATFKNCRRAIEFILYNAEDSKSRIVNSTFVIDDDYIQTTYDYRPISQISLWNISGVEIRTNDFINENTEFQNSNPVYYWGTGVKSMDAEYINTHNTYEGFYNGIDLNGILFLPSTEIKSNTFRSCRTGIFIRNGHYTRINTNTFEDCVAAGAHIWSSNGFELHHNTFDQNNSAPFGSPAVSRGLYLDRLGTYSNGFYNNAFSDNNMAASTFGNNRGLSFDCNDFDESNLFDVLAMRNAGDPSNLLSNLGTHSAPLANLFSTPCIGSSYNINLATNHPPVHYFHFNPNLEPRLEPTCTSGNITTSYNPFLAYPESYCSTPGSPIDPKHEVGQVGSIAQSDERLGQLDDELSGKKAIVESVKEDVYTLIDDGETQDYLSLIADETETSSTLAATFSGDVAPFVSAEVLSACVSRDPEMDKTDLLNVLLANSPLPWDVQMDSVLIYETLNNQVYYDSLWMYQSGVSPVDSLQNILFQAENDLERLLNKTVITLLTDTFVVSGEEEAFNYMISYTSAEEMLVPKLRLAWQLGYTLKADSLLTELNDIDEYEDLAEILSDMNAAFGEFENPMVLYTESTTFQNKVHSLAGDSLQLGYEMARDIINQFEDTTFIYPIMNPEIDPAGKKAAKDRIAEELESEKTDYDSKFGSSIRLYPNPARHEIRIAGDQSERFKEYRILSIDGRLVKSGRLTNEQVISAKQISPGLYVVVLLHDEGNITRKIVIE